MHRSTSLSFTAAALVALLTLGATGAEAQGRSREPARQTQTVRVPKGYEPPPGMCRLWLNGVPAAQQPAPTDCATAIKRRPSNASLVFGERVREGSRTSPSTSRRPPSKEQARESRTEPSERPATRTERQDPERRAPQRAEPDRPDPPPRSDPPERRGRSRIPPNDLDEQLVREQWLDEQLLAALYEAPLEEGGGGDSRVVYGRGPEARAATRARGLTDDALAWAVDVDGRPLSARDVERWLRADELLQDYGPWRYLDDDGRVLARWGECFDRNFDGRCDDLSAGTDGCFDRNLDGRCDDARWDAPGCGVGARCVDPRRDYPGRSRIDDRDRYDDRYGPGVTDRDVSLGLCFDRDRDGRCDEPWSVGRRIPQTLPEMAAATALQRGVASFDVERWLGRTDASARATDRNGDGIPERVIWLDARGQVAQVWTDRNGDGIADRVELFRDGLPVQVVER